jgi:hypothetical protein
MRQPILKRLFNLSRAASLPFPGLLELLLAYRPVVGATAHDATMLRGDAVPVSSFATRAHFPTPQTLTGLPADREQLTGLLRGLAADLDELDRRLFDLSWRPQSLAVEYQASSLPGERTALLARREQLTTRFNALAQQLKNLDSALSTLTHHQNRPAGRVGTCPHCGYPSLDSGLCAYCRPFVAH